MLAPDRLKQVDTMSKSFVCCLALFLIASCLLPACTDAGAEKIKAQRQEYKDLLEEVNSFPRFVAHPIKENQFSQSVDKLKEDAMRSHDGASSEDRFKASDVKKAWRDHVAATRKKMVGLVKSLPASEQAAANRLLSDMFASSARAEARRHEIQGYIIEFESSRFIAYLDMLGIAHDRALRFRDNTGPLTTQLAKYRQKTQTEVNDLQSQVDTLKQNNTRLESEAKTLRQEARTLQEKSDNLMTDATIKTNLKEKTETIIEAAEARRAAFRKDADAERREKQVVINLRLLSLLEAHLKVRIGELAQIDKTDDSAAARKAFMKEQYDAAMATHKEALDKLQKALTNLTQRYKTEVEANLFAAAKEMKKSYDYAKKGADKAKHKTIQTDIVSEPVSRKIEWIHIMVVHSNAAKGMGLMMSNSHAHARSLGLPQANEFKAQYDALYNTQLGLIGDCATLIDDATVEAEKLEKGDAEDQIVISAKLQLVILEKYKERLGLSKLPAQPPASIKPVEPLSASAAP